MAEVYGYGVFDIVKGGFTISGSDRKANTARPSSMPTASFRMTNASVPNATAASRARSRF